MARAPVVGPGGGPVLYSAGFGVTPGRLPVAGYLPVFIYLALIVAFALVSLGAAFVLRPARPYFSKLENYECGAEPIGEAWVQFPVGFYLVALIFVVFDALAVFLFPWALVLRSFGLWAMGTMGLFLGILSLGWVYAYKEGILEWK
jgi:NADH-quinone oxidoreductase subunit A